MIEERGLEEKVADEIGEYVQLNGGPELIEKLLADERLKVIPSVVSALDSMKVLLKYCGIFGLEDKINFDLGLARGLDYYTGSIIETVLKGIKLNVFFFQEKIISFSVNTYVCRYISGEKNWFNCCWWPI